MKAIPIRKRPFQVHREWAVCTRCGERPRGYDEERKRQMRYCEPCTKEPK